MPEWRALSSLTGSPLAPYRATIAEPRVRANGSHAGNTPTTPFQYHSSMLTVTHTDPFASRLASYAQRLDTTAAKWNNVDSSLAVADRYLDSADRTFDQAWHPQRQASWDNERTDSSWHGRDLARAFRQGDQELNRSEHQVRLSQDGVIGMQSEIQVTDSELDGLIAEMRHANDARLAVVLQASEEIAKAQGSYNGVSGNLQRYDSSALWVDQATWQADAPIQQISFDRPGRNVSSFAHQVGNSLRTIDREIQGMDWALRDADRHGDQGQSLLREAAAKLQQASRGTESR